MSTLTNELGTTQPTPPRRLIAAETPDPMLDEALRRARRIDELDRAAHAAASLVRTPVGA